MKPPSRSPSARAVLGAMAWRLPDDDWHSPWSFEEEWITPPKNDESGRQTGNVEKDRTLTGGEPALRPGNVARAGKGGRENPFGRPVLQFEPLDDLSSPVPAAAKEQKEVSLEAQETAVEVSNPVTRTTSSLSEESLSQTRKEDIGTSEVLVKEPLPEKSPPVELNIFKPVEVPSLETPPAKDEESRTAREETPKRRPIPRRSRQSSWGTLISLSLGTLGFTLLAWIYLHDSPRESDEDLRPVMVVDQTPTTRAPEKLKAFLTSLVPVPDVALRSRPAWLWDTPTLADHIRANSPAFDNLRDLLEDYDWHPHHADWHREDLSEGFAWEQAGHLLQARALYLARRGEEESAFSAALDMARLSRRLQDVWAWPGYLRRSLDMQSEAMQTLAALLKSTRLDSATLGRFQVELSLSRLNEDAMRQASAAGYVHEKKLLLGPSSGELLDTMPAGQQHPRPARLFFKMNETLGLFATAFRELRDELTRPPYTRLSVGSSASRIRLTAPKFYYPNSAGEAYFSDRIAPLLQLPQHYSLTQAKHSLVRCFFALRRYLADRRSLPPGLQNLMPAYLDEVPKDPFSGEAVQFDGNKGLLYSVGINLIGEGGRITVVPMDDDREPTLELGIATAVAVPGN